MTDTTSGLDRYEVFLDDASVETTTATTVHLAGLSSGVEHRIYIKAVDAAGLASPASAEVKVTTLASSPAAPPELVVAHAVSGATVFVSWGSPAETLGPVTYHVWRSEGGSWERIGVVSGLFNRSFVDASASSSTRHSYAVSVEDDRGIGLRSVPTADAVNEAFVGSPEPPRAIEATASDLGTVTVDWDPVESARVSWATTSCAR